MTTRIEGVDGLKARIGDHLGYSDWLEITQERVDQFAEATGDHQWIHVDPERAEDGPFGGTIAHGYLTLSLIPMLATQVVAVSGVSMGINYGTEKVRFPSPVPVGSSLRLGLQVVSCDDRPDGSTQVVMSAVLEVRDAPKPACVAETVTLYYP